MLELNYIGFWVQKCLKIDMLKCYESKIGNFITKYCRCVCLKSFGIARAMLVTLEETDCEVCTVYL